MEETNGELTVTIRAKNMPELRKKLLAMLGETESDTNVTEEDFPDDIKSIFPDYEYRTHGAAMLTVLHEKHQGKQNAVDSLKLAEEMVDRFPRLFKGKTVGKVSAGNVFSGNGLKKRKLIQVDYAKYEDSEDEYRMYWVQP
jgi:hypothetical protein